MSTQLKLRRDTQAVNDLFTGAEGEPIAELTNDRLVLHDGSRQGGFPHVNFKDHTNNTFNSGTGVLSGGVYTVTLPYNLDSYVQNQTIIMTPDTNNTGAVDININGIGIKDIKRINGSGGAVELTDNQIVANVPTTLIFDTTANAFLVYNNISSGSGLNLIQRQVVTSPVANIDFTMGITSAYDNYKLIITDILPVNNGDNLFMRTSSDGGATYDQANGDYHDIIVGIINTRYHMITFQTGNDRIGNNTVGGLTGNIDLFNLSSSSQYKRFFNYVVYTPVTPLDDVRGTSGLAGSRFSTNPVNALRFFMENGNIARATVTLYGVRKE